MAAFDEWTDLLKDHPIFDLPYPLQKSKNLLEEDKNPLELSTTTLSRFLHDEDRLDDLEDIPTPSGRRQTMLLRDTDLVVAVRKEIRITALGDAKLGRSLRKAYKKLHTPNIQFDVHQIALNPNGKLLAVAGSYQVAVIVLPRTGFARLVPETIDCKCVQIGQYHHAAESSAPVAKIDWHPWGEAASTLLVMTTDGTLREYDISTDTEEPQQVLSFVPPRSSRSKSFMAEDKSEREVSSFTLGKGQADWGPLTVYALMRSGDIYAFCPYLPKNASVPSTYVYSLESFVSAKQDYLTQMEVDSDLKHQLTTIYDYQHKYVSALIKQLPPGTVFSIASRPISVHPPAVFKGTLARQGPFLLQPAPRILEGSEGGDATDIAYLSFQSNEDEDEGEESGQKGDPAEFLGIITVAYQDGKVDLFLDVEKIEARWDTKDSPSIELPVLAVYESIDLGFLHSIQSISTSPKEPPLTELLRVNYPAFMLDPVHNDTFYVYHAFGVHALYIGPVLETLASALRRNDNEAEMEVALTPETQTLVQPLLSTFSVERKSSSPIVGVALPNDVYLSYSILVLTSSMRISMFPLTLRSEKMIEPINELAVSVPYLSSSMSKIQETPETALQHLQAEPESSSTMELQALSKSSKSEWLTPSEEPSVYVSILKTEPFKLPNILSRPSGLPMNQKLSLPDSAKSKEMVLTPDTLRYLGNAASQLSKQIREVHMASRSIEARVELQQKELTRMTDAAKEMNEKVNMLRGERWQTTEERMKKVEENQAGLFKRLNEVLKVMMRNAAPELSEQEKKWFEELARMKEEVKGVGRYDAASLAVKTKQLEKEYARIMPAMKALAEKEKQRKNKLAVSRNALGVSQAFNFGQRSNMELTRISVLEEEITQLARKLNLTLIDPPKANFSS